MYKQYHQLSEQVRNDPQFKGRDFCAGDQYIDDCADINVGTGNLGTWVFVDMNNHIAQAAVQVQSLMTMIDAEFSVDQVEEVMEVV